MLKTIMWFTILCTLFFAEQLSCEKLIELVTDDDILGMIRSEKYVIVLFSKRDCDTCVEYENVLRKVMQEVDGNLDTSLFTKVENSQLTRLYSTNREPVLVFFRHGVPLLYDGPVEADLILHTFTENVNPVVKELTDETFEHLTQASSGATTGDWFILFYTNDCIDCQRMHARLEAVGARLKNRVNIARVNKDTGGTSTAKRFKVHFVPTFILFRHGKLYRYMLQKYDVHSLVSFAQDWYKNATPENVPNPETPFDILVSAVAAYLQQNTWIWTVGIGSLIIGILASVVLMRIKRQISTKTNKVEKKSK